MATQKYANLAQSTITGAYTAGNTTITVQSGDGALFPSSGDFTIAIDDPPSFFLKCTSRTGDVLTVSATGQEGTTAVNKSSLTKITQVITAGALDAIRGDLNNQGTLANLPSTTGQTKGNTYTATDTGDKYIFDGSSWLLIPNNTPNSVNGLEFWLSADNITGLVDGNTVVSWYDFANQRRGRALSAQGTSSSNYPIYKTNIVNSKPVVRFAGVGWFRGYIPCFSCGEFSIFMVFKMSSLVNTYTSILSFNQFAEESGGATGAYGGYLVKSTGKTALYLGSTPSSVYDGSGNTTLGTTNFQVVTILVGPESVNTRVALADDLVNTSFNNTSLQGGPGSVLMGADRTASRRWTGDLAEFIVYGKRLNTSDRDTIESYLKTKYGL